MTESFFNHYLDFFKGSLEITLGALTTIECITLFFIVRSGWFLTGFSVSFITTLFFTLNYLVKFQNFKANLYMYFPKITKKDEEIEYQAKIDKIIAENTELPLKACQLYALGKRVPAIQAQLGLTHPEQAHRVIQRGVKELLENQVKK